MNDRIADRTRRTEWFQHDRFGMFIHWGIYSIPARGEWVRSHEQITIEDYEPFFKEFNPVLYDPKQWAHLAKEAGMKYAVLTAKHHDGFCLFDSALTDYKSTNTPCGRDLVREYLDAFRAEAQDTLYCFRIFLKRPSPLLQSGPTPRSPPGTSIPRSTA